MKYEAHEKKQEDTIAELNARVNQDQTTVAQARSQRWIWSAIAFVAGGVAMGYAIHEWDRNWH